MQGSKQMKTFIKATAIVLMLLALAACKIELAVPDDETQGTETPEEPVEVADTETAKAYLKAFDDVLFLKDLHAAMKGEKAAGVVTTLTAGTIAFDGDKTELAIPLTFTGYDFDGKGDEETAGLYTRTATGTATLALTGKTDQGLFKADAYKVKALDVKLQAEKVEGYVSLNLQNADHSRGDSRRYHRDNDRHRRGCRGQGRRDRRCGHPKIRSGRRRDRNRRHQG